MLKHENIDRRIAAKAFQQFLREQPNVDDSFLGVNDKLRSFIAKELPLCPVPVVGSIGFPSAINFVTKECRKRSLPLTIVQTAQMVHAATSEGKLFAEGELEEGVLQKLLKTPEFEVYYHAAVLEDLAG